MRFLGVVCAAVLVSSLGTLAACSAADKEDNVPTAKAVSAASVKIALFDQSGARVGDASGVLIAPRLVLTAGHSISGKYKWEVTSADGKQKVLGSRGLTYDWMTYDSSKAHPRRHDVGVIHLDAPIKLDSYPRLVGDKAVDNLAATRIRGTGSSFETLPTTLKKVATSPNAWLAEMNGGETLDTGGAVYDERGIVGVVSGRGLTTGNLYVARTDQVNSWLAAKVSCAAPRTYAAPAESKATAACDDAGASSGNPSNSSSGNSGNPNGGSPGGSDGSCSDNNDGVCSGAGCGTGGTNGTTPNGGGDNGSNNGSDNGNNGGGSSGSSGSSGSNANQNGGDNGNANGGSSGQSSGESGSGSANGSSGSSGANGNQSSSGGGNGSGAGNGSGGGSSSGHTGGAGSNHGGDGEACQGASDNPETCPPEADGCSGSACGGGYPDDLIEYGNCACSSHSSDDGDIHVR